MSLAVPSALEQLPWAAKYVTKEEDDRLVFISFESRKREAGKRVGDGPGPTLVVHSSVPWGFKHSADASSDVANQLMTSLNRIIATEVRDSQPVRDSDNRYWW